MKKKLLFILTMSLVMILAACGGEKKESLKVFKNETNEFQISALDSWKDAEGELNDEADLQIYNMKNEKYFITLMETKEDFDDFSLKGYFDLVTEPFLSSLDKYEQGEVKEITINGNDALQYTLEASLDNIIVVYLVTVIETPTHYGQLLAWTLESKWYDNKYEYFDMVNSFKPVE